MQRRLPPPRWLAVLLVAAALTSPAARAQRSPVRTAPKHAALARVERALAAPALRNATVGVLVRSLDSGRTLFERGADAALLPASNQKILTAVGALALLGADYRYATELLSPGTVDNRGTLQGDLYLRGAGDPSLDAERLLNLAFELKKAGIERIDGRLVADASRFDEVPLGPGWQWDDEPFAYSAQISALGCDANALTITLTPADRPGDPAAVSLGGKYAFANRGFATVVSTATTTPAGVGETAITIDRARGRNEITVKGTIPRGAAAFVGRVTLEQPALYAAHRLADALERVGIALPRERRIERGVAPPGAFALARSLSAPLSDLTKTFLKDSDNLYGECLLKTVGAEKGGGGSAAAGAKALRDFFVARGLDLSGVAIADGSGLSRMNAVTPRFLVALLVEVATRFDAAVRDAFFIALPEGGVDGTLKGRFQAATLRTRVRAKTGTLTGVSSLSGYVTTMAGERLVFSILVNQYDRAAGASAARAAQDAVIEALVDLPR